MLIGNKKYSYGELAADAALIPIPENVSLKSKSEWKYIGKGNKRLEEAFENHEVLKAPVAQVLDGG